MSRKFTIEPQYLESEMVRSRSSWKQKVRSAFKLPQTNIVLFLLTIFTTYGLYGIWYCVAVMTILLAHEMGHYLMCRRYRIRATLPFFIPFYNHFGTMGAVIKIEDRIPHRKALFDVGAAGPLSGLFFTIPAIVFGVKMSSIVTEAGNGLSLGESLLFHFLTKLLRPEITGDVDLMLHPLAFAGWFGLFVTALNLLPIGQLDGGHIVYSIFGKKSTYIYRVAIIAFAVNTLFYPLWIVFLILLITFGQKHPPPIDNLAPLDLKRKIIGGLIFLIFILSFTPIPFDFL